MNEINLTTKNQNAESAEIFEITEIGTRTSVHSSVQGNGILFLLVTAGKMKAYGRGIEKNLSEGECIVADLSEKYRFTQSGEETCRTLYAVADGRLVYDLLLLYGISDFMTVRAPECTEALTEIHKCMTNSEISPKERYTDASPAFHRLVSKIKRASLLGGRTAQNTANLIKNYIDSHLEEKLTLEELSKMFFVSKTQIFRMFKEAYGIAPIQYFLQKKIELAKQLLANSDIHISEIAESLSFTDSKHFTKTFKKFAGDLPRNYRREIKAKKLKSEEISEKNSYTENNNLI